MADSFHWPPRDLNHYLQLHRHSLENREQFWTEQARRLAWRRDFQQVVEEDLAAARMSWFGGGRLCLVQGALFRHGQHPALVFLDHQLRFHELSGRQLEQRVRRAGAALSAAGLEPGGRLLLYLPNIPEAVILTLAAAWLGATLVPVPARFAAEQVVDIAANCSASLAVVAGGFALGDYNQRVQQLVESLPNETTTRLLRVGREIAGVERLYSESVGEPAAQEVAAEHPLALLYAGSATGIPRGSVIPGAGLLVQADLVHRLLLRFGEPEERRLAVYCAVDLAAAAGLAHGLWGPLLSGDTVVLAGTRTRPPRERLARLAERFAGLRVITSPDRLQEWIDSPGPELPARLGQIVSCQDTLTPRLAARAGETLVERPWQVVNMWVQNESGCGLITGFPSEALNRPGALGLPLPGIAARVVGEDGRECARNRGGRLVFACSWPALARNIWGQPQRYHNAYFSELPGHFSTRDAVRRDREGFLWFMARRDDVVKSRGLSLRTGEIEALLQAQAGVVEAAVVGAPGGDHGEELVAFVAVDATGERVGRETVAERLREAVKQRLGPLAVPQRLIFCEELPRTETGKLARLLLRNLAAGRFDEPVQQLDNPHALAALRQVLEE